MAEKATETETRTPEEVEAAAAVTTEGAQPDTETAAEPDSAAEPKDAKEKARQGFEARQSQKRMEALEKELEGYKRREEDARKAKLSEDERLREERDELARENEKLRAEKLQAKVATEFKLPAAFAALLVGTDEEALRAHAEEIAKFLPKPRAGSTTDPVRDQSQKRIYTRAELQANPTLARSEDVKQAALEGRIH